MALTAQSGALQDPTVIDEYVPTGIKGLLIAGLMAAAMSTFDSTVNSGAAYWVNDIYRPYINPGASAKTLLRHSRLSSVVLVAIGLALALAVRDVNDIRGWITGSLGAGLLIPTMMRWYWWRMNGWGFSAGIAVGMAAAIAQRLLWPHLEEYFAFLFSGTLSLVGMVVVTLATRPTSRAVLQAFYRKTRPFEWWAPVRGDIPSAALTAVDAENRRDRLSTVFAIGWQLSLFLMGMSAMMKQWDQFFVLTTLFVALSIALYFTWFRHLSTEVSLE